MSVVTTESSAHAHHPFLQHHFEDLGQQHEASTLGMWMFLATEILFFGAGLLIWMMMRSWRGDFGPEYYGPVEIMGLYWHFVDIVWIFLFPFLYLIHGVHHG